MRIAVFDYVFERDRPGRSGLSDIAWNTARHLAAQGDEVFLVGPYQTDVQPPSGVVVRSFRLPLLNYQNAFGHVLIAWAGWREIKRLGSLDLIFAPEYLSIALFGLVSQQVRLVFSTPGNIYERLAHGNPFDWWYTQVLKIAAQVAARRCAALIAISSDQREWWLRTGTPANRISVVPYGVDFNQFHFDPHARRGLGIEDAERMLLFVGRLSPEKGVATLIEAFAELRNEVPMKLHIVGEGPAKGILQTRATDLGVADQLVWHGQLPIEQVVRFYSAADVCVIPSHSEPLGRVVLEAMACRCLVVASAVGGIVDHIYHEQTGFLFPPGDTSALVAILRRALCDPTSADIAANAQARIINTCSWPTIVDQIRSTVFLPILADAVVVS